MKWIGQHIWDFISRFRSTVYFENLETSSETNVLVVDGDGKVTKNSTAAGDITGVIAGDGLTGGGASGSVTVNVGVGTGLDVAADEVQLDLTEVIASDGGNRVLTSDGDGTLTAESGLLQSGTVTTVNGLVDLKLTGDLNELGYNPDVINYAHGMASFTSYQIFGTGVGPLIEVRDHTSGSATGSPLGIKAGGSIGTNASGGSIHLIAGRGTGSADGGDLVFWSSTGGSSGSSYNTSGYRFYVNNEGNITSYGSFKFAAVDDGITFEGGTHDTTLKGTTTPSAARTITLPDATGTVALTSQLDHDTLTNFVANEHIDWTGASAGTIHASNYSNDNDDVSVANLKTRLAGGFASNAVSIGDSDDTVTIPGNLTVSGTTTTINTTDLNVEDKNITLNYHPTNDTSGSADGAGITVQDAVNAATDATINWDAAGDFWNFSHKVSLPDNSGVKRNNFWLNTDNNNQMTKIVGTANGSNKTIELPNISGSAAILDLFSTSYTAGTLSPSAGVYTAVTNLDMAAVYGLNSTAATLTPTPHSSQTIMLTDCWVYVTTPNYTTSGVANTSNWAFMLGKTSDVGNYNKAKGFEGLINRLAYNQPANRTNVHRMTFFPNGSSDYGNPEPGLPLKVWTSADPSGSASVGSESIMSIKLVVQYTIIPS